MLISEVFDSVYMLTKARKRTLVLLPLLDLRFLLLDDLISNDVLLVLLI